jgi:hypothetical protein
VICLAPDTNHPPLVVETHNLDCVRRYDYDDPEMPESMLAVTNHMRKLQDPYYCSRYETIKNAANEWAGQATLDKMWGLAGDVAMDNEGVWEGWITAQTMIFLPVVRKIGLAYSDNDETAWTKEPTWLDWNELFGEATDDDSADDDSGDDDSADDDSAAGDDDSADDDSSSGGCGC